MSAKDILALLSIAGLLIAFVSASIPQFFKTSLEEGNRKYLTRAGMIALAVSALGLLTAVSSALVGIAVRHEEAMQEAVIAREKARQAAQDRQRALQQRQDDELWRQRSQDLAARILSNTDQQLETSEATIASMLEGFRQDQLRQQRTFIELQRSTNRILIPIGRLTYNVGVRYLCDNEPLPQRCNVKSLIRPDVATASDLSDLVDPAGGPPIALTLYFALPTPGQKLTLRGSTIGGSSVSMYGRVQSVLQTRSPPDLFIHNPPGRVSFQAVRSVPVIPPAISRDLSSMLDLEGRTLLVWGPNLAEAESISFSVTSMNDVDLRAECSRASPIGPGFEFSDDSYRHAFACQFGTIF